METKGYWNRRAGYEKLDGSGCRKRKTSRSAVTEVAAEPPSSHRKRESSWVVKLIAPLKFKKVVNACDVKKFCVGLRDAYVDFMIRNADTSVMAEGMGGGYGGAADDAFGTASWKNLKEYDEKMIVETYKSVDIDHGNLVPHLVAPRVGS